MHEMTVTDTKLKRNKSIIIVREPHVNTGDKAVSESQKPLMFLVIPFKKYWRLVYFNTCTFLDTWHIKFYICHKFLNYLNLNNGLAFEKKFIITQFCNLLPPISNGIIIYG